MFVKGCNVGYVSEEKVFEVHACQQLGPHKTKKVIKWCYIIKYKGAYMDPSCMHVE